MREFLNIFDRFSDKVKTGTYYYKNQFAVKYEGQYIKHGIPYGKGTRYYRDGSIEEGEWNVSLNGKGSHTWSNGEKYEGEFSGGQAEGKGVYTWPNGKKYVGKFHIGKKHGKGVMTWPDGKKFEGTWENNKKNGNGILTWDGGKFEGTWENDKKTGYGTYTFKSGRSYQTSFDINGHENSGVYKGVDAQGNRYQVIVNDRGDTSWKKVESDKEVKTGILSYYGGGHYEGEYITKYADNYDDINATNIKHGKGVFTWENGDRYDGEWKDDVRNGKGVFINTNGKLEGEWKDDVINSNAKWTSNNGYSYITKFYDGKEVPGVYKGTDKDGNQYNVTVTEKGEYNWKKIEPEQEKNNTAQEPQKTDSKQEKETKPDKDKIEELLDFATKYDFDEKSLKNMAELNRLSEKEIEVLLKKFKDEKDKGKSQSEKQEIPEKWSKFIKEKLAAGEEVMDIMGDMMEEDIPAKQAKAWIAQVREEQSSAKNSNEEWVKEQLMSGTPGEDILEQLVDDKGMKAKEARELVRVVREKIKNNPVQESRLLEARKKNSKYQEILEVRKFKNLLNKTQR